MISVMGLGVTFGMGFLSLVHCKIIKLFCPSFSNRSNRPDSDWKHEDASEMMFDALIKENGIDIPVDDQKFIKALISGDTSRT
jgi:hypothetical protein